MSAEKPRKNVTKHLPAFVIADSNAPLTPLHFCSPSREGLREADHLVGGGLCAGSLVSRERRAEALGVRHDASVTGAQRARGIVAGQAECSGNRDLSCDEKVINICTLDDLAERKALAKPECLLGVQALKTPKDSLMRFLSNRDSVLVTNGHYGQAQSVVHRL